MTPAAWITMLVICGFVWGGFLALLVRALRSESAKRKAEEVESSANPEGTGPRG